MIKKIKYQYVDSKGSKHKLDIKYIITPYTVGDMFSPPENGEVEIYSITKNGVDFEVADSEIIEIEEIVKKINEEECKRFEDYDF